MILNHQINKKEVEMYNLIEAETPKKDIKISSFL